MVSEDEQVGGRSAVGTTRNEESAVVVALSEFTAPPDFAGMDMELRQALKIRANLDDVAAFVPAQIVDELHIDVPVELSPDAVAHGDRRSEDVRRNRNISGASIIRTRQREFSGDGG